MGWPDFSDLCIESRMWRIGTMVVLNGLQGHKTRHLNGHVGSITPHPREGHPVFVQKASSPGQPVLMMCVHLEHSSLAGMGTNSVLLEPKFLTAYDLFMQQTAMGLASLVTRLK